MVMTADCDVCGYVDKFLPIHGFIAFRAGLSRVGVDALKAACQHRKGSSCSFGLQLRDQLIDTLWGSCLDATKTEPCIGKTHAVASVIVNAAPALEGTTHKKRKTGNEPADVTVSLGNIHVGQQLHDEEKAEIKAFVAELSEEVKRLRSENQKLAESQQQLLENQQQLLLKQAELLEIVQRLQRQQEISDRLLCTVYDRQRSPGELQLRFPELPRVEQTLFTQQTDGN
ncbi:hypothetical protein PHYPSEUDO_001412 [Phytophthora pseudosyringae]|uniref:Uncharacterized protein n=1 Tax=Phytophthora pseudosyringae TaxID=221518 RepID=A0A8T1WIF4_9STRA|nr:hypothetical protein PHYPSEUDO_001412 [Phytophthora pseudosyringae]